MHLVFLSIGLVVHMHVVILVVVLCYCAIAVRTFQSTSVNRGVTLPGVPTSFNCTFRGNKSSEGFLDSDPSNCSDPWSGLTYLIEKDIEFDDGKWVGKRHHYRNDITVEYSGSFTFGYEIILNDARVEYI